MSLSPLFHLLPSHRRHHHHHQCPPYICTSLCSRLMFRFGTAVSLQCFLSHCYIHTYNCYSLWLVDGHVSHAISFFRLLYGWRRWNRWILCSPDAQQHATNTGKAPGPSSMTCLSSNYTSLVCIRWFVSAHICIVQQVCCIDRLQFLWARYRAQSQRDTTPMSATGSPPPSLLLHTLLIELFFLYHIWCHTAYARAHTHNLTLLSLRYVS